jgi:hypothetical protein
VKCSLEELSVDSVLENAKEYMDYVCRGSYQTKLKMATINVNNVEIPAPYGDPLLLLHELENPINLRGYKKTVKHIKGNVINVIYGTSGSGKTRTVLEMLAQHPGLYFASDIFKNTKFASQDMLDMITKLKSRLMPWRWNQNEVFVTR